MGSFADAMQVAPAKARDSRKPEIGIRRGGRVVERMDGRVSERGQHNVIAVPAVIVDRKLLTVGGELRALRQPGEPAVYRIAPEVGRGSKARAAALQAPEWPTACAAEDGRPFCRRIRFVR